MRVPLAFRIWLVTAIAFFWAITAIRALTTDKVPIGLVCLIGLAGNLYYLYQLTRRPQ